MRSLYIFNPDTDYALASGSVSYTPSRAVLEMSRKLTLLPALWAERDAIILASGSSDQATSCAHPGIIRIIDEKNLHVTDLGRIGHDFPDEDFVIKPWGWNPVLCRSLMNAGIAVPQFTTAHWNTCRRIAHRRETISLNRFLSSRLEEMDIPVPTEIFEAEDVMEFRALHGDVYLKDPWSSSGRGVLSTAGLTDERIMQWSKGIIRRHGSIMAETAADKKADCSSLWHMDRDGTAGFMGFSMFMTSQHGRYTGQIVPDARGYGYMSQRLDFLNDRSFCERLLSAQKDWLESNSHGIEGYVGIDMLVERSGNLRPGIEVNRRMTMGTASILIAETCPNDLTLPAPFIRITR